MLSRDVFVKGMIILSTMKNPIDREDKAVINVWYEVLKDIPDEVFFKACVYLLKTSIWHPSVAEIREAAGYACDVDCETDFTAEQQWDVFRSNFSSSRIRKSIAEGKPYYKDPITQHVAELIYQDYGPSLVTESGNWRARFISTYNNVKTNGRRKAEMQSIGDIAAIAGFNQKVLV